MQRHFLRTLLVLICTILIVSCSGGSPSAAVATYKISYFGNGATSGKVEEQTGNENSVIAISDGIGFVYQCHAFASWNTAADGSGKTYKPGDAYTVIDSLILFAQWKDTHTLIHVEEISATCTDDGNEAYDRCSVCGYTTYRKMEKLGHDIITVTAKESTCTEVGWNEHRRCSREGCSYTENYTEIPATGHSYSSSWSYDTSYHWHSAVCGHSTEVSSKSVHTWNSSNVCSVCGIRNEGTGGISIDSGEYSVSLSFPEEWNGSLIVIPDVMGTVRAQVNPANTEARYAFYLDGKKLSTTGDELQLGIGSGKVRLTEGSHTLVVMASLYGNAYTNFCILRVNSSGSGTADSEGGV